MYEKTNNYEKWCNQWREKFLKMDLKELQKRLPELKDEGDRLTITHFGRRLGIRKGDGQIMALDDQEPVTCYEQLNVYTLFGYVSPKAYYKDQWVRFDQLKDTAPFSGAFEEGVIKPFLRMFGGRLPEFSRACVQLDGKRLPWSDAGYELKAFACIPVRFLLWEGDEEFPAQGNLLFDASATDFIHGESVVTIAAIGLCRLAGLAGITMDRSAFPVF